MRDRRVLAILALALVEGSVHKDPLADDLAIDAFSSTEAAATAHAYLAGFLIEFLAAQRGETVDMTLIEVRRLLGTA